MPGPFPGMDPYLERRWGDVYAALVTAARTQLNSRLPPDLVCRAEENVITDDGDPDTRPIRYRPDDYVIESGDGFGSGGGGTAAAVLEEVETYTVQGEPATERWLEIRTVDDERVVTSLEVLSPANKKGRGWELFTAKQQRLVMSGVSLVEIDLLRRGHWSVYPDEDRVPEQFREPYRLVATSAHGWPRSTFSRVKLRESLPPVAVPLRLGEPLVALDVQSLFDEVWRTGRYASGTHYRFDPPPFPPDDAAWIAGRVREWSERRGPAGGGGGERPERSAGDRTGPTAPPDAG